MSDQPATLLDVLTKQLDQDQVSLVCLELGLDYAQLPGANKAAKVQSLLQFCAQGQLIGQLQEAIRALKPKIKLAEPVADRGRRARVVILVKKDVITFSHPRWTNELIQTITTRLQIAQAQVHILAQASAGPKGKTAVWLGMPLPDAEKLARIFDRDEPTAKVLRKGLGVESVHISKGPDWDEKLARWRTQRMRGSLRLVLYMAGFPFFFAVGWLMAALRYPPVESVTGWAILAALPGWILWIGLFVVAMRFTRKVYGLQGGWQTLEYVWLCLFGPLLNYPFVFVQEGKVDGKSQALLQGRLDGPGGPALFIVFNDSAVVLERNGQRSAILGPSVKPIGRMEKIQQIIDLRPQTRGTVASVITRDGIPLKVKVEATYRIRWRDEPTVEHPYPADPDALVQAAACEALVKPEGAEASPRNWVGRISGNLDSELRSLIARYRLDELFEPAEPELKPRAELRDAYITALKNMARNFGGEIMEVRMDSFEFDSELIKQQWMETWRAYRSSQTHMIDTKAKADAIRIRERARTSAQVEMITGLIREFESLDNKAVPISLITLRFVEAIRRMATSPEAGIFLPREAYETLEGVQKFLKEGNAPSKPAETSEDTQRST